MIQIQIIPHRMWSRVFGTRGRATREFGGWHLRNEALFLEHGGAGSTRALSEVVPSENDVASTSGSKLLPPVGRELLAAVKLGLPGAKEEFDKQQRLFEKRFGARRMGRMYNETGTFRGMWKKETQFAAQIGAQNVEQVRCTSTS